MKAKQRWNRWEIVYRVPGYDRTFSEHFDTEEAANLRIAEIELAKREGKLKPPGKLAKTHPITVGEFLDEFVEKYGVKN